MAKPIFIIKLPMSVSKQDMENTLSKLKSELTDYHVIALRESTIESIVFECHGITSEYPDATVNVSR